MTGIVSGIGIAFICLVPPAVKWGIKLRHALAGVVIFGAAAGLVAERAPVHHLAGGFIGLIIEAGIVTLLAAATVAVLFHRDPDRVPVVTDGVVVSPADGKVVYVRRPGAGRPLFAHKRGRRIDISDVLPEGRSFRQVGIGMNLLDVHVNRAPVAGKVTRTAHLGGEFLSLKRPEAVYRNERVVTVIEHDGQAVGVVMIASRLVRRIDSYVRKGQNVALGERIGMIRFGSQVDVVIPDNPGLNVLVQPGDEVKAGVSVIAEYRAVKSRRRS